MNAALTEQTVLIIDDDRSIRQLLGLHFEERGHRTLGAATAAEGEATALSARPDVIILDVRLPDRSGIDAIASLRQHTDAPILMITGLRDMATTILAMKGGAFDFIPKPIDVPTLDAAVERALEHRKIAADASVLEIAAPAEPVFDHLVGDGERMRTIYKEVGKIAASQANVLVTGESGTGKELLARIIHQFSCPTRPFVPVNCAAIVEQLLESDLFGHEKGAFTGAIASKIGKCELAADGTLFLDEIGDLSLNLQAKLLRVLQEREFERVGGVQRIPLRARVIAATHRDLEKMVAQGRFREDLYQRLKVVTLQLPALRDRTEDIPKLVEHLLSRINAKLGRQVTKVPQQVMTYLQTREWSGNVRELENALTRAVVLAPADVLGIELLSSSSAQALSGPSPHSAPSTAIDDRFANSDDVPSLDDVERQHIVRVLKHTDGHRGRTCELLGISRPTLMRKIRKYNLAGSYADIDADDI